MPGRRRPSQLAAGGWQRLQGVADAFGRAQWLPATPNFQPGAGNFGYVDVVGNIVRGANTWLLLLATPTSRVCFGSCGPQLDYLLRSVFEKKPL